MRGQKGWLGKRGKTYYIGYYVDFWDEDGKKQRKLRREAVGPSERQARIKLNKILAELDDGKYKEVQPITFRQFAAKWIDDYASGAVKSSTLSSYQGLLKYHLIPHFADKELAGITIDACQGYVSAMRQKTKKNGQPISPKTINNSLVVLKEMLKHAVRWGYLASNPADFVEKPRVERKEMDFLTPTELKIFLEKNEPRQGSPDYAEQFKYYAAFTTAALSGVRRGELLALRKSDLNWPTGHLHVRRSLYKGKFIEPKSRNSIRAIKMSPTLQSVLKRYLLLAPESDLLFANATGGPLDGDTLTKRDFVNALRRAGLRKIRLHDLRHSFASYLIAAGENPKFIQTQLGHSSIQTTMDRYGHLLSDIHNNDSGARLDALIFGDADDKPPGIPKIFPNELMLSSVN